MNILEKLFDNNSPTSDGWKQEQREALIDLLVLAMYIDNELNIPEDAVLQSQIDSFQWESSSPVEYYVNEAISRVRAVRQNESSVDSMITYIAERLDTYDARMTAAGICERLLSSDGKSESERAFLDKVHAALKTQ